jgi:molybdate/tungstate transport system substrate-binding protein
MAILSCNNTGKEKLIIFHAGSLSVPFKELAKEFKKENPNVIIEMEAAGSRNSARKISDLNKHCDIMASADYTVIESILMPNFTNWYINFVTNEMTIVYTKNSRYSNIINNKNWFEIIQKEDVAYGRSDPDSDPCGYRTEICLKLAEIYYNKPGLAEAVLKKDNKYIRPKETDLLALLESNALDYIFIYKSVAEQHKLEYLSLPDSINLKLPELNNFYSLAATEISGNKPGEKIVQKGEAMVYGITILKDAPNRELAIKFLKFLFNKSKGIKIMEKNGQPSIIPSITLHYDNIPIELKEFVRKY